jgi:hypothetical protein
MGLPMLLSMLFPPHFVLRLAGTRTTGRRSSPPPLLLSASSAHGLLYCPTHRRHRRRPPGVQYEIENFVRLLWFIRQDSLLELEPGTGIWIELTSFAAAINVSRTIQSRTVKTGALRFQIGTNGSCAPDKDARHRTITTQDMVFSKIFFLFLVNLIQTGHCQRDMLCCYHRYKWISENSNVQSTGHIRLYIKIRNLHHESLLNLKFRSSFCRYNKRNKNYDHSDR